MAPRNGEPLLTCKEIAQELRRHISYVYAMKRQGFSMPAGRARFSSALLWLKKHPSPRARA